MSDGPVVLGINRTQDASICLMQGSRLLWAIQKERLTRHKHHWGKLGDIREMARMSADMFGKHLKMAHDVGRRLAGA